MKKNRSSSHGLTVVELLVVVGIVALLVGLMVPAFGFYKEEARSVKCMGNMRHIFGGIAVYAMENSGYIPPPKDIRWAYLVDLPAELDPFGISENAFRCPKDLPGEQSYGFEVNGYGSSYKYFTSEENHLGESTKVYGTDFSPDQRPILKDSSYVHRFSINAMYHDGHMQREFSGR